MQMKDTIATAASLQVVIFLLSAICGSRAVAASDNPTGARTKYEQALGKPGLKPHHAWDLRLRIAHTYLWAKDYPAARNAYAKIATGADAPPGLRSDALLCIAHTYVRTRDYKSAAQAFAKARDFAQAPAHHRSEANERITEMDRLARGLPARDPAASRMKLPPSPKSAAVLYVSANGNNGNPGTKEHPLADLPGARDAIRKLRAGGGLPKGGITVYVRGGVYPVRHTFELTAEDSGTPQAPIRYQAVPGEIPRFTGGVELDGFSPVTDKGILARIPEHARGKVLMVDLKSKRITDYGTLAPRGYTLSGYPCNPWVDLYVNGRSMHLAKWPNRGFVKIGTVHKGGFKTDSSGKPGQFEYADDRPKRWAKADDVWMFGYWGYLWAGRYVKIDRIDTANRRITTAHATAYGYRKGQPYYCLNLLDELDAPGEWYLDRNTGVLYLCPPADMSDSLVQFPVLSAPFVVMKNASNLTIRSLVFELGRMEGAVITGGANNLLAGCTFRQLGTHGVIVRGGTGHGVLGCDIHTLGAGGVMIAGGDHKTLTPGKHFVENCHIRDFTRVDRVYAPAVHLDGVGNRIAHNLMHDSPHHGMRIEGYEHVVEFNEVHSVVYESDDQSGVDMWGNPAYRGNVIRYNFWHHIGSGHNVAGQAGIRLDDYISAVLVYGNVFYRCAGGHFGGVQIHGGKDNIVENNLFVDCESAVSFSAWGKARWLKGLKLEWARKQITTGGVDISKPPHSVRYPDLARMTENPDRNFIWRNLAINCGRFTLRDSGRNELMDNCIFNGDAGFADQAKRDLTLPPDSPVYDRLGFRPIPFDEIGLYKDKNRATWPVKHDITPHYFKEH